MAEPAPDVQRILLALVYQMEALVDELAERKVIDRDRLRARVEALVKSVGPPPEGPR